MLEASFRAESPAHLIPFDHVPIALERVRAVMAPAGRQPGRRRSACRRRAPASSRKSSVAKPSSATKASSPALRPRWWSRRGRASSSGMASWCSSVRCWPGSDKSRRFPRFPGDSCNDRNVVWRIEGNAHDGPAGTFHATLDSSAVHGRVLRSHQHSRPRAGGGSSSGDRDDLAPQVRRI